MVHITCMYIVGHCTFSMSRRVSWIGLAMLLTAETAPLASALPICLTVKLSELLNWNIWADIWDNNSLLTHFPHQPLGHGLPEELVTNQSSIYPLFSFDPQIINCISNQTHVIVNNNILVSLYHTLLYIIISLHLGYLPYQLYLFSRWWFVGFLSVSHYLNCVLVFWAVVLWAVRWPGSWNPGVSPQI